MIRPLCRYWLLAFVLGLIPGGAQAAGQEWSGSVGAAIVGQSREGSLSSFRTQTNLDEGFSLEELTLHYKAAPESQREFTLRAWGFGDAEPSQHARLKLRTAGPWRFSLGYDRRESLFELEESELGLRSDRWDVTRSWGEVTWDGWSRARLGLKLRRVERDGTVERPFFGLNERYPLRVALDETLSEAAVRIESRGLPVKLSFEQALAAYRREDRRSAAGSRDLEGDDVDLLAGAETSREDDQDVPTSRLTVSYAGERVEVVGAALWSPAQLESSGVTSTAFDLDGGAVGRVEFIDELLGSADMDTLAGNLRLGLRLAPDWHLRLESEYRDSATDATVLGQRILRLTNPRGQGFDIAGSLDDGTVIDVTDSGGRVELEWTGGGLSVHGGVLTGSREVSWRLGLPASGASQLDVDRDTEGAVLGLSYRVGRRFTASAEYEHGDFERFVLRTDPETVDRLGLRLRAKVGRGLEVEARGRFEEGENPQAVSGLDHSSDALSLRLSWGSRNGETGFGVDLDHTDLTTVTGLVLPGGREGLSRYDLALSSAGFHGHVTLGPARLQGAANRLEDAGDTWPAEAYTARLRVAFDLPSDTEVAFFGQYWEYDEDLADGDDFEVTRFGVAFHWRFP